MGNSWIHLLLYFALFAAPALSWMFGKAREQYQLKRAREEAKRERDEALRSTVIVDRTRAEEPQEDPRARAQRDLAARRQAQLQAMREKRAAAGGASGESPAQVLVPGGGPGRPGQQRQQPPARPVPRPTTGGPRPPRQVQRPARAGAPATARPRPGVPGQRQAPARPRPAAPQAPAVPTGVEQAPRRRRVVDRSDIQRTAIGQQAAAPSEQQRGSGAGVMVRQLLQRGSDTSNNRRRLAAAMALVEVMDKPIAMRQPDSLPWNRG